MKLAIYEVKGVSCGDIMRQLSGTLTVKNFLLATISEYTLVPLEVEFRDTNYHCKLAYVKVSLTGSRMWREVFSLCCEEAERAVMILKRIRGVGRVGADVIGHRLLEFLKSENPALEVVGSDFF